MAKPKINDIVERADFSRMFGNVTKISKRNNRMMIRWNDDKKPEFTVENPKDIALVERRDKKGGLIPKKWGMKKSINKKGWKSESARHSLARKGIKTGRKKKKFYTRKGLENLMKMVNKATLTIKPKAGTYYEIERDETEKEKTSYYLQIYNKKTDELIDEIPLGQSIPKQFKKLKVRVLK